MAKSFGAYKAAPRTTGIGQGSAQVFAPQAIPTDASGLSQGLMFGAQQYAAGQERKRQQEIADLERQRKLMELKQGQFSNNNSAKQEALNTIVDNYESGKTNEATFESQLNQLQQNSLAINEFEKGMINPLMKDNLADPNKLFYDPEGKYNRYADRALFLTGELTDEQKKLIEADPTLGLFNQSLQNQILDLEKSSLSYDPEFSLDTALLDEFSKYSKLVGDESTDVGAAVRELQDGYDLKTVIESRPDLREDFMDYLSRSKSGLGLVDKWSTNYLVDQGLSPYHKNKPEFKQLALEAMLEEAEGVKLPAPQRTTRMSVSQQPKETGRDAATAAIGDPVPYKLPTGTKGGSPAKRINTMSSDVFGDKPMNVETGDGKTQAGIARRISIDPETGKMYLQYSPYVNKESGALVLEGVEFIGGDSKYVPDLEKVYSVELKGGKEDPNYDALVRSVMKSTKSSREDVLARLDKLQEVVKQPEPEAQPRQKQIVNVEGKPDLSKWTTDKEYQVGTAVYFYDDATKSWKKRTK